MLSLTHHSLLPGRFPGVFAEYCHKVHSLHLTRAERHSDSDKAMFEKYDRWRSHPILRFMGPRDLKHAVPGFGTAAAVFGVYLLLSSVFGGSSNHHGAAHDHHAIEDGKH